MNTINVVSKETNIVQGEAAISIEAGTIVRVHDSDSDTESIGNILMRTDNHTRPFVTLHNGNLWGNELDGYTFKVIPVNNIQLS